MHTDSRVDLINDVWNQIVDFFCKGDLDAAQQLERFMITLEAMTDSEFDKVHV
jgi:hypothetical protein